MNATVTQIIIAGIVVLLAGAALVAALYYAEKKGASNANLANAVGQVGAQQKADTEIAANSSIDDAARSLHDGSF
jgi:hypothetical protein